MDILTGSTLDDIIKQNSKFFLFKKAPSNILIISWGAAGGANGVFTFYKTLHLVDVNVLFISFSGNNIWYANGVPGLGNSLEITMTTLARLLPDFCIKHKITEVISLGTSMGAYTALLFSHFIKNKLQDIDVKMKVLALGCETELFLPSSNSLSHNNNNFSDIFPSQYKDINDLYFYADDICLYFGEYFLPDCYCALKLRDQQQKLYNKRIKLISIKDCTHNIAQYLNRDRGFMKDFFIEYLSGGYFVFNQGAIGYTLVSNDIKDLFFINMQDPSYETYLKLLLKKYFNWGYCLNRLGVLLELQNRFNEAYKYLYLSSMINSNFTNNNEHLDYVIKKIKNKYL